MGLFDHLIPKEPEAPGLVRSAADTGVALAKGGALGVKMLADAFGADNAVSRLAGDAVEGLQGLESAYSRWEQEQSAREMQAAAESGSTWEEVKAAGRAFARRPIDFTAEAVGTSLPTIAAAFLPGGQTSAIVRIGAMLGLGGAQGAGAVKGQIHDAVRDEWLKAGSTPEEAAQRAQAAQEYFGDNAGQVALGTALGAAAGTLGAEANILSKRILSNAAQQAPETGASLMQRAARSLPGRVAIEGTKEAVPEALQGGQEQLAANMALRNEGFDVNPMEGVAGNATLEALGGMGAGGAAEVFAPKRQAMQEIGQAETADQALEAFQRATAPMALPAPAGGADWELVDGVRALPGPPGQTGQLEPIPLLPSPDGQVFIADERGNVAPQAAAMRAEAVTRGAELADQARQAQAERQTLGKQTPRGAEPQPPAQPPIPVGDATELVPAGEATEVDQIPVGEATELIDTPDATELPRRIPVGKATEIEPELVEPTDPGVSDGDRGEDPPDAPAGAGGPRLPDAPGSGGAGAVRDERLAPADAPAGGAGRGDREGEGAAGAAGALTYTDLTTGDGKPYGTRSAATVRARKEGGEVVEVEGGWVVRVPAARDEALAEVDAGIEELRGVLGGQPGGDLFAEELAQVRADIDAMEQRKQEKRRERFAARAREIVSDESPWKDTPFADRIRKVLTDLVAAGPKGEDMAGAIASGFAMDARTGRLSDETVTFREGVARRTLANIAAGGKRPEAAWSSTSADQLREDDATIATLPRELADAAARKLNELGPQLAKLGYADYTEVDASSAADARQLADRMRSVYQALYMLAPARYGDAKGHKNRKPGKLERAEQWASEVLGIDTRAYAGVRTDVQVTSGGVREKKTSGSVQASGKRHPKTIMGSPLLGAISRAGGLDPAWLSEFSTRFETARRGKDGRPIIQWRNPMVPGIGKLFRRGGTQDLQRLAEIAEENGYLEPGAVEADTKEAGERAKAMIQAALNRQDVQTLDEIEAERQAGEDAEREAYYAELDAESAAELEAERQAIMAEAELTPDEQDALDDIPWDEPGRSTDRATAMRALGFTEEEIADEAGREEGGAGERAAQAPGAAPEGSGEGRAPGADPAAAPQREGQAEGLSSDPAALPEGVRNRVERAIEGLRGLKDELDGVLRARGHGYIFSTELVKRLPRIRATRGPLDEFRRHAERNGFDAEAIIAKLGGDLNLEPYVVNDRPILGKATPNTERLLCMPCGEAKLDRAAPAGELYQGPMWQTLRQHQPAGGLPNMLVLSAKYGMVDQAEVLQTYDQRLTPERAAELRRDMVANAEALKRALAATDINEIMLVGGADYRAVMAEAIAELMANGAIRPGPRVNAVEGSFLQQRKALGEYLRWLPGAPDEAPAANPESGTTGQLDLAGGEFTGRQWTRTPGAIVPAHATHTLTHNGKPFLQVQHAGHPTALRPWYLRWPGLEGAPDDIASRKFSQLADAKAAAEKLLDDSLSDAKPMSPTPEQLDVRAMSQAGEIQQRIDAGLPADDRSDADDPDGGSWSASRAPAKEGDRRRYVLETERGRVQVDMDFAPGVGYDSAAWGDSVSGTGFRSLVGDLNGGNRRSEAMADPYGWAQKMVRQLQQANDEANAKAERKAKRAKKGDTPPRWENYDGHRIAWLKDRILWNLAPGRFGGSLTAERLNGIDGDPERNGYTMSMAATRQALDELEAEGKVRKTGQSYALADEAQAAVPEADAEPEGLVVMPADEDAVAEALAEAREGDDDWRWEALFKAPDKKPEKPKVNASSMRSQAEADKVLKQWRDEARKQGRNGQNNGLTVISLFDASGAWSQPWLDAGYNVVRYDLQDGQDIAEFSAEMLLEEHGNDDVWAILAAPPCTDFASSGAQYWAEKDADGRTEASNELVRQVIRTVELFRPAVWAMENPVGRMAKLNKLPPPLLTFQPNLYGDPYTKKTQIWGNFNNRLLTNPVRPSQGSKITEKLSSSAKYERSLTPEGFAYSFFHANNKATGFSGPVAPPGGWLAQKFHGVDAELIQGARFGRPPYVGRKNLTDEQVAELIEDDYNDGDLEGVNAALEKAAEDDRPAARAQRQGFADDDERTAEGQRLLNALPDDKIKALATQLGIEVGRNKAPTLRTFIFTRLNRDSATTLPIIQAAAGQAAGAAKAPARDDAIVELRRQKSVLDKLVECLSK